MDAFSERCQNLDALVPGKYHMKDAGFFSSKLGYYNEKGERLYYCKSCKSVSRRAVEYVFPSRNQSIVLDRRLIRKHNQLDEFLLYNSENDDWEKVMTLTDSQFTFPDRRVKHRKKETVYSDISTPDGNTFFFCHSDAPCCSRKPNRVRRCGVVVRDQFSTMIMRVFFYTSKQFWNGYPGKHRSGIRVYRQNIYNPLLANTAYGIIKDFEMRD